MDITKLSNTLLEIFYIMIGLYMATTMVFTLKDKMEIIVLDNPNAENKAICCIL